MPGTKEIRSKIASVKSTQKITKAMQMVATSKMRRAQDRMKLARPYADKIRQVIGHLTQANPDYRHPFMAEREPKAVGIIVISTDRGLAGGLNANIFKQVLTMLREWQGKGAQVSLCLIGSKGLAFFRRLLRKCHGEIVAGHAAQTRDSTIKDSCIEPGEAFRRRQRRQLERFEQQHRADVFKCVTQRLFYPPAPKHQGALIEHRRLFLLRLAQL